jgi:hypothetical protein
VSHAQKGEEWLEKHLQKAGKTKADFAKTLFERNLTAVAEVSIPVYYTMVGLLLARLAMRRFFRRACATLSQRQNRFTSSRS